MLLEEKGRSSSKDSNRFLRDLGGGDVTGPKEETQRSPALNQRIILSKEHSSGLY